MSNKSWPNEEELVEFFPSLPFSDAEEIVEITTRGFFVRLNQELIKTQSEHNYTLSRKILKELNFSDRYIEMVLFYFTNVDCLSDMSVMYNMVLDNQGEENVN